MDSRTLKKHLRYMIPQIKLALIKESGAQPVPIRCPDDIDRFVEPMKLYAEEHFIALHLDAKNQVIGYQVVSHGTVSASLVHPREVFKAALLSNAHAVIVAHNHPAGSRTPSEEDIETTRTLVDAGKLLGVSVVDHIIVSTNGNTSLREEYPSLWRT